MKKNIVLHSFFHALAVVAYTSAVAWFLFNGERIFGRADDFWVPVVLLLLFVVSATIVGSLVLGPPVYYFFSGKKEEALKFLFWVLGWIIAIGLLIAIIVFMR